MEFHPLADIFPLIEGAEFEALVDSIRSNGQLDPIVTYEDKILDGRNRYRACQKAGHTMIKMVPFDGEDPVKFVLAKNLTRRHLDESQRAFIAAQLVTTKTGGQPTNPQKHVITTEQAATMLNVSPTTVSLARKVLTDGTPEQREAIQQGAASVTSIGEALRTEQRSTQKGRILSLPQGKTPSEAARVGMAIEKEQGSPAAAKASGLSRRGYHQIRDMLLLSERTDLAKPDAKRVQQALAFLDETHRLTEAYAKVEPLIKRIWGEHGRRAAGRPSGEQRLRRLFDKALSLICNLCERAPDVVVPHLTGAEKAAACKRLEEAREALGDLIARIREERT